MALRQIDNLESKIGSLKYRKSYRAILSTRVFAWKAFLALIPVFSYNATSLSKRFVEE
jgi:hypothetical protein